MIKRKCEVCGNEFSISLSRVKRGWGKFCSYKCKGMWQSKNTKGNNHPNWKGRVGKICRVCGKTFEAKPCELKKGKGKYCSLECRSQATAKRGSKNPLWSRIEKECLICKKRFEVIPARIKVGGGKFCSRSCVAVWYIKHSKKKNTSIELKVEEYLTKLGIKFESQKVIPEGRTVADFYIPEQRLVIYADGTFWHKSEWAKKEGVVSRDQRQDFLLGMNGYKVLRLPEKEIKGNPQKCINKIKRLTKENDKNNNLSSDNNGNKC